ncbi:MAG: UDP-N-acetylmuramate dehydrogenase [Alphaproteobacteria bacterium]
MAGARKNRSLIDRLAKVRGSYTAAAELARLTRFRVGGPAEVMFQPADRDDLAAFMAAKPADVPVTVIGAGSNMIVRDGGIDGVVLRLGRGFAAIEITGTEIKAGCAALNLRLANACRDAAVTGLEFLCGIPGSIGGSLRMNGGAHGREMKDITITAEALDGAGNYHLLGPAELGFSYRHSAVAEDWIFLGAGLKGEIGRRPDIVERMEQIQAERADSQPLGTRTGGSTFVNPDDAEGRKAWQLIDEAGCRGLKVGGAQVSEQHCNFLINTGAATAADIEALGEEVRRRVFEATGVRLEWEIRRLGRPGNTKLEKVKP